MNHSSTHPEAAEVRLGNDIARQFAHLDEAQATDRITDHIVRFWDPRMRRRLRDAAVSDPSSFYPALLAASRRL